MEGSGTFLCLPVPEPEDEYVSAPHAGRLKVVIELATNNFWQQKLLILVITSYHWKLFTLSQYLFYSQILQSIQYGFRFGFFLSAPIIALHIGLFVGAGVDRRTYIQERGSRARVQSQGGTPLTADMIGRLWAFKYEIAGLAESYPVLGFLVAMSLFGCEGNNNS